MTFTVRYQFGSHLITDRYDDRAEAWSDFMRYGANPSYHNVTFNVVQRDYGRGVHIIPTPPAPPRGGE